MVQWGYGSFKCCFILVRDSCTMEQAWLRPQVPFHLGKDESSGGQAFISLGGNRFFGGPVPEQN